MVRMTGPWDDAVARALDGTLPDIWRAVQDELVCLWSDLDEARRHAINGVWSMQCDWLTERIVLLSRLATPAPWGEVPTTVLLDGTYSSIMTAAGLTFEPPDLDAVRELIERTSGRQHAIPRKEGNTQ